MTIPVNAKTRAYTFIARVHPERYGYSILNLPTWNFTSDDGTRVSTYRFQLNDSQMTILAEVNYEVPLLDLKNEIAMMAGAALDSLGFIFSAALSLEIIGCIDDSGVWHVFNTIFDGFREQGDEAQKREFNTFNTLLPHALTSSVSLALSDLRRAISEPHDTVFHCYRAIETIRQEYIEDADDRRDRIESWNRLRTAIGISRDELDWLKDLAEPRRHGKLVVQSHETRIRAIRTAREVVYKHCAVRSLDPHVKVQFGPDIRK
jgi:hypothetical protein